MGFISPVYAHSHIYYLISHYEPPSTPSPSWFIFTKVNLIVNGYILYIISL